MQLVPVEGPPFGRRSAVPRWSRSGLTRASASDIEKRPCTGGIGRNGRSIAGALVLVSAVAGWYLYASRSATGEPEVAPTEPTQVRTGVATPDEIDESGDLNWDQINIDDSVDLRVGDCFDDPSADQIEHVKAVRARPSTSSSSSTSGRWARAATRPTARSGRT
jgi:hypothetical protein